MKKTKLNFLTCVLALFMASKLSAQFPMSGTYNVPATYSTIGAAINALNTYGVLGPVVINVAAGYTETATAGGYTLTNVVGTSSVNTVTFQKNGSGTNPMIFAYTGGTNTPASAIQDGVWRFIGSDYITIDGIDINDPNTTNPGTMEFGYGFFKANANDGCQFNTIRNCTITLSTANNVAGSGPAIDGSRGIDVVNALVNAHTTNITVTNANGANSNNRFYGNRIQNCNYGISIIGFAAGSPFTLADQNNDIGGSSSATGNTIVNFGGGGTNASSALRTLAQYNLNCSYNTINNNTGSNINHTGVLRGILLGAATSANASVNNNTITLQGGGTTTQLSPIENTAGSTAANNTITINNNLIVNCTYTTATSGTWFGIFNNAASANHLIMSGNTFSNNSTNATSGSYYNVYNTGAVTGSVVMNNNTITGITFSATATTLNNYNIMNTGGAATSTVITSNNSFSNFTYLATTGGTGAWAGIYSSVSSSVSTVQNNLFNNISLKNSGTVYLIYHNNASYYQTVSSNSIITAFNRTGGGTGTTYIYYNLNGSPGRISCDIYDNDFSNFNNGSCTGTFYMMYSYYGCDITNIYNNKFNNISAPSGSGTMYGLYGPYYSVTTNIYNNSFTNITYGIGTVYGFYLYDYYSALSNIYGNTWGNITAAGSIYPVYYYYPGGLSSGTSNFYRNKINDISTTGASSQVFGIYVLGYFTIPTVNIHNNLIGGLTATASTNSQAVTGIYLLPQAAYNLNVYFNSVYLSGTSTGSGFGSNGFYSSASYPMTFANNLVVNNSVPTGAGIAVAHRRSSATISTYNSGSDNNLYYAGIPSSIRLIYTDGVNNLQTLGAYKTFMSGKEAAAVTENPPFAVLTGSASNYLSISGSTTTQIESGALPVVGFTTDYNGTTRSSVAPDIGAWEGNYLNPNTNCSGTPNSGTITVSPASGCANTPFAVSVSGQTGLNVPGISYQWQTSASSSGPWTNMSGIVGPSFQQTAGVGANTFYRLVVTCSTSALSATTAVVGFSANTCIASATLTDSYGDGWNGGQMALVVNGQTTTIGSGFTTGTSQVLNFCLPNSSTYSLYLSAVGSYPTEMGIILNVAGNTFSIVGANSSGPLSSATAGSLLTSGNTCTSVPATCSNVVSGSVTASANSGCANQPIVLTGSGLTSGPGIVYQWQSATSTSGPWTSVSGATNTAYTATPSALTYYRLVTTCTVSSNSATTAATNGYTVNSCAVTLTITDSYGDGWNGGQMALVVNGQTTTIGTGFTTGVSQVVNLCLPTAATYSLIFSATGSYPTEMGVIMNMGGSNVLTINGANSGGPLSAAPAGSVLSTGLSCQCSAANGGTVSTATYSICGTSTLNFSPTGFSGGTGISYTWQASPSSSGTYTNFVGGSGNNTTSFTTPTLSSGTYFFRMAATCNTTLTGSSNIVTVNVVSPASPSVAVNPSVVCSPGTATLTASGATSYTWSTGATGSSIVITPSNSAYYFVTGTGTSPCPDVATSNTPIYFSMSPTVSASSNTTQVCSGLPVNLTASGASTYSWSNSSSGASITINPTTTAVYTVTGFYPGGCFASSTVPMTVNPVPSLNTSGSTGICTGQNATVTASGASTYSWSTGATVNSIVTTPPTGTTVYTVTGTSSLGCISSLSHTVNVAASLSISIVGPSSICIGQTANLAGNGGVTYTWNTGATTSTIAPSPTVTTTYSIIGSSGTCSNTGVSTVTVNPNPTVSITGGTVICNGQTTTLNANGASTYTWNTSATGASIAISPSVNTTYILTGTSAQGCTATTSQAVISNSLPIVNVAQSTNSICVSSVATFTASGANTYTWSNLATTTTISITPTASAVYSVNGTNAAGCVSTKTFALGTYALPVILIAPASTTICSLSQANFTASGASTYTWNASATATNATYSNSPASSAVYTVQGTSTNGCVNVATVAVTTNSLPVISITPPTTTVCALSAANFTANGASTYTWNNSTPGNTITLFQANNTTHTVSGTNAAGCISSGTVGVTTTPLPTLNITPSFTTVCVNTTFTASVSGAVTYSWVTGATGSLSSITPSATSSYSVMGTDALGCSSTSNVIVVTNTLPVLSISPASSTVCSLSPVNFTASGASTFTWNTSGPNTATVVLTPTVSTTYTVSGTDAANGCIGSKTVAVVALSLPAISVSPSNASVCPGSTASLTASGAVTYSWLALGGAGGATVAVTPSATTVYSVVGTDTFGCVGNMTVTVVQHPVPNISPNPASQTICVNETASITASGANTYTWNPGNSNGSTYTVSPTVFLQYTVSGTDANNCNGSSTFFVYVNSCTGLQSNSNVSSVVSVFPNPTTGKITAKFEFEGRKEILISDGIGRIIETRVSENLSEDFDLTQYAKGVYYVKIKSNNNSANFKISMQ